MWGFWVRAALVCGDGVDAGQNDGVLFLQYVPVVEGVFLRCLCRSEVAVAMLRTRETKESDMQGSGCPRTSCRFNEAEGIICNSLKLRCKLSSLVSRFQNSA